MSIRTTKPLAMPNQQLALDLAKAILLGGAIKQKSWSASSEVLDTNAGNKLVKEQARLDAAYAVNLYQGIIQRLEKDQ